MYKTRSSIVVMACLAVAFLLTSCSPHVGDKPTPTEDTMTPAPGDADKVTEQPAVSAARFADLTKKHIGSTLTVKTTLIAIKSTGAANPSFGVFEDGRVVYRGVLLELSDTDMLLRSVTPPEKRVRVSAKHIRSVELSKESGG